MELDHSVKGRLRCTNPQFFLGLSKEVDLVLALRLAELAEHVVVCWRHYSIGVVGAVRAPVATHDVVDCESGVVLAKPVLHLLLALRLHQLLDEFLGQDLVDTWSDFGLCRLRALLC